MVGAQGSEVIVRDPSSAADFAAVRALFLEYREGLGVDLCFQGFDEELATLPGAYAPPRGRLWLADRDGIAAGCVGLRPLADHVCEMKRLYVRPALRGHGLGKRLATTVIDAAKALGYRTMYLDTLATMTGAIALYRALGFRETAPYYQNPLPGPLFFGLDLV